jgi:TolB-like protein/Flp pilus assembly protein TadD
MVKGQYSAKRYKGTDKQMSDIARELGVDAIIRGSVLKADNDVRITVHLVDGKTDAHLWSDNYTETLTNILALQSQVTLAIAREIEVALTPEEERRIARKKSVKPEAYEAYLKGILFHDKLTEESLKTAANYFKQAIEIQPDYTEAHAWLAASYWTPAGWGYVTPHESFVRAKKAANTAIELDNTCGEAHCAMGWITLSYDWDWQKAKQSFEQSIDLTPNFSRSHQGLAFYLLIAGRFDEAIEMMQTAVKLDPLSPNLNNSLACVYMYCGRIERAIELHKEALKLDPFHLDTLSDLARTYLVMSRYADAVKSIEDALNHHERTPSLVASLARTYALWGKKSEAEKLLQELQDRDRDEYILPSDFARVYAALGNKGEALTWLEKAYQEREGQMILLRVSPWWDSLRKDPRFNDVLKQMNFPETSDPETVTEPIETAQTSIEKIAVLPFTSISNEAGEEWFVDGMTVTLTTQLGRIKALTVISSRSAMELKGTSKPVREIAQELGVEGLIEGTVIRVGNKVQITAQLIDGRRDEQIWADIFQGTFDDILALQSEVTLAIAKEIEVALTPEEKLRIADTKPINPEAYEAFLKGKFFWNKRTEDGSKMAIHYFEQAIEQDPSYALAHAGLADCYNLLGFYTHLEPNEAFPKAKEEAEKALNIDDTIAEAYASLGYISLLYEWDWKRAESQLKRAIDLNPNYATAQHWYSVFLSTMERHDESIDKAKQAQALDPGSNIINTNVGFSYYNKRQYDQAIEAFQNALLIDEGFWYAHWGLGLTYVQEEMYEEALTEHQKAKDLYKGWQPVIEMGMGFTYACMGRRKEAQQVLNNLLERSKQQYVPPFVVAILYFSLQENDQGFTWLEKAYKIRNPQLSFLGSSPLYDSVRSDPRFTIMLKKMGLDK